MANKILERLNKIILVVLIGINLVGVFMPELGFDALWYHLTLSKLFLFKHQWYFPGGLFYYSAMPRFAELISLPFLALFGTIGPKFIQFASGLISVSLIYRLAKKNTASVMYSLSAVNLFYATWLVSWQSSSAYVDLVRTALELSALYIILSFRAKSRNLVPKLLAGILVGLAIGTKWHALGSLLLMAVIFTPVIILPAVVTAMPWFLLAFHFTGNPVYPLFENFMTKAQLAQVSPNFYSLTEITKRFLLSPFLITKPIDDFLSPVMGIVFLISLLALLSANNLIRKIALYGFIGTLLFLLVPPPSTRYYLPYLPAVILSATYVISRLKDRYALLIISVFTLSAVLMLGLRMASYIKYVPYVTEKVTLNRFLFSQQARLPDTFIDVDDYVATSLPPQANYLIANLHNLYYFPNNYDHETFIDKSKHYDYLITKNTLSKNVNGKLLHTNQLGIQIFKLD